MVAEHIIDKKLDNHDDKYNYAEQNNINLLLSNSMILDTTNSVNTTLQVNEVKPISDKDINQKILERRTNVIFKICKYCL